MRCHLPSAWQTDLHLPNNQTPNLALSSVALPKQVPWDSHITSQSHQVGTRLGTKASAFPCH